MPVAREPTDGGSAEEPPSPEPTRARALTSKGTVIGTTVLTAVVGALATAIISPERIDRLFGAGDAERDRPPPISYKRVAERTGAVSVRVPDSWAVTTSRYEGVDGVTDGSGRALRTGPDPTSTVPSTQEVAWVGASRTAPEELGLLDLTDDAARTLLQDQIDGLDYRDMGCTRTDDHLLDLAATWVTAVAVWEGCGAVEDWRVWEVAMLAKDRRSLVTVQIGLSPSTPDEVAEQLVESVTVVPSQLPGRPGTGDSETP